MNTLTVYTFRRNAFHKREPGYRHKAVSATLKNISLELHNESEQMYSFMQVTQAPYWDLVVLFFPPVACRR